MQSFFTGIHLTKHVRMHVHRAVHLWTLYASLHLQRNSSREMIDNWSILDIYLELNHTPQIPISFHWLQKSRKLARIKIFKLLVLLHVSSCNWKLPKKTTCLHLFRWFWLFQRTGVLWNGNAGMMSSRWWHAEELMSLRPCLSAPYLFVSLMTIWMRERHVWPWVRI